MNVSIELIIFVVLLCLKLTGAAAISWLVVFSPLIFSLIISVLLATVLAVLVLLGHR